MTTTVTTETNKTPVDEQSVEPSISLGNSDKKKVLFTNAAAKAKPTWETRDTEQSYAKLNDKQTKINNRYGQPIDLLDITDSPKGRSMHINENPVVGDNPNRNKQHGFFFTADNCIGCHACESACSEKNENPAHIAFRSVGYLEGGSYPDVKRMNISMACNHCDDPVCLKGCPTRAYTKHAEYGAVLQDPETCFGCGYCTWVCPYNAPQLDPVKGQVSKCNMCVDRLEVGLKPSCVSACVGNALDFGVIENIPENREQAKTSIPGFPDPSITQPNIRFQQTKSLPDTMCRTDSAPVKYQKDESGEFVPVVDQKKGKAKHWNFKMLSSKENPLVIFTLSAQMAIGAFAILLMAEWMVNYFAAAEPLVAQSYQGFRSSGVYLLAVTTCLSMIGLGLFMSTMHLGKPFRFYRGFNNLRHSPVCREGLGIALFMLFLAGHILFEILLNPTVNLWIHSVLGNDVGMLANDIAGRNFATSLNDGMQTISMTCQILALPCGLLGIYYMNCCYRIKARPFWDHWQVATSFFGNMLSLGAILVAASWIAYSLLTGPSLPVDANLFSTSVAKLDLRIPALILTLGVLIESIGLLFHAKAMNAGQHEGAASHYVQQTTFGKSYILRNGMLVLTLLGSLFLFGAAEVSATSITLWVIVAGIYLFSTVISRALFYVLVIPTTMPGAFFWKNKGFEEHAREIGLAKMPQVGVV